MSFALRVWLFEEQLHENSVFLSGSVKHSKLTLLYLEIDRNANILKISSFYYLFKTVTYCELLVMLFNAFRLRNSAREHEYRMHELLHCNMDH